MRLQLPPLHMLLCSPPPPLIWVSIRIKEWKRRIKMKSVVLGELMRSVFTSKRLGTSSRSLLSLLHSVIHPTFIFFFLPSFLPSFLSFFLPSFLSFFLPFFLIFYLPLPPSLLFLTFWPSSASFASFLFLVFYLTLLPLLPSFFLFFTLLCFLCFVPIFLSSYLFLIPSVLQLFHTRYTLHKRAYHHSVSDAIDLMVAEAIVLANPYLLIPGDFECCPVTLKAS